MRVEVKWARSVVCWRVGVVARGYCREQAAIEGGTPPPPARGSHENTTFPQTTLPTLTAQENTETIDSQSVNDDVTITDR